MTKRKLMLVALSLCMVAILAMGGTLAYLTDEDDVTNVFTVGNVEIELTEPSWDVENGYDDAYPGEHIPKDPKVTNIGDNPCYIRVGIVGWQWLRIHSISENDIYYATNGEENALGDGWAYNPDDNYFYFTDVVSPDAITAAVFTHIVIPSDTGNSDDATEYTLEVWAEAVQSQGAEDVVTDSTNLSQLHEWFVTCGMPEECPVQEVNHEEPEGGEQA